MRQDKDQTGLVSAAEALLAELRRFEANAEQLAKTPMNSQKNLERAARLLTQVAESDQRLEESARALIGAISKLRERQQGTAEGVRNKALELQDRTQQFTDLMTRYGALGREAGEISAVMQQSAATNESAKEGGEAILEALLSQADRLQQLADDAQSLADTAKEQEFAEIERHAESLRQQLMAARNRISLLRRNLA